MAMIGYGVSRNCTAVDKDGKEVKICLAVIQHDSGMQQRLAIPEELIRYAGEGVIELEVKEAALKGGAEYIRS
jgi:hypothetical protein